MCIVDRNIDFVLCIDGSSSMGNFINLLQKKISDFYSTIIKNHRKKGVNIKQIRIKIICFRNFVLDEQNSFFETKFFLLPNELSKLEEVLNSISPFGGSPNENSGLEALATAINSDWIRNLPHCRQIILLFSDTSPNKIRSQGLSNPQYPAEIPSSFDELTDWWEDVKLNKIGSHSKRLILFAPEKGYWADIGLNWCNTIHVPCIKHPFKLDSTILPMDYIISTIVNSI